MATAAKSETPKVYASIATILKSLSVEKGGTLPSNMGGKSYITAVDLANEVKRQFVANNLILLPRETMTKHEVHVDQSGRKTIFTAIEGEYTIVHTEDGSSVTIGGAGDGLATGTAVSSNIASTNALKNAMLRFLLVTEQSVEDAAKNGEQPAQQSATDRRVQAAKAATPQKPAASADDPREQIRALIEAGKITKDQANQAAASNKDGTATDWAKTLSDLQAEAAKA